MFDFLYRKIVCYYCGEIVRRKDAVEMSLMVQGKLQEKLWVCRRCANVIRSINQSWKCGNCTKKCTKKPMEKSIVSRMPSAEVVGSTLTETLNKINKPKKKVSSKKKSTNYSGQPLKYVKSKNGK